MQLQPFRALLRFRQQHLRPLACAVIAAQVWPVLLASPLMVQPGPLSRYRRGLRPLDRLFWRDCGSVVWVLQRLLRPVAPAPRSRVRPQPRQQRRAMPRVRHLRRVLHHLHGHGHGPGCATGCGHVTPRLVLLRRSFRWWFRLRPRHRLRHHHHPRPHRQQPHPDHLQRRYHPADAASGDVSCGDYCRHHRRPRLRRRAWEQLRHPLPFLLRLRLRPQSHRPDRLRPRRPSSRNCRKSRPGPDRAQCGWRS